MTGPLTLRGFSTNPPGDTVGTVSRLREILLNGVRYPIEGPVRATLTSLYAPKLTIGDVSAASAQGNASVVAQKDWRGGLGVKDGLSEESKDRSFWSTCHLQVSNHLILPRLAVTTGGAPSTSTEVPLLIGFLNHVYGVWATAVHKRDNDADTWGASLATLPANPTDAVVWRTGATTYLIIAHGGGYTYTTDGVTWTDKTTDIKYLVVWRGLLFGIDSTGLLKEAVDITSGAGGSWGSDAQLPLPDDYVNDLILARDSAGEVIPHALTKVGPFAHNADTNKWEETELEFPPNPNLGVGSTRWHDGATYITMGGGVIKYTTSTTERATAQAIGPDRHHGLPEDKRGVFTKLIPTVNELIGIMDSTTAEGAELTRFGSRIANEGGHRTAISTRAGYSPVLSMSPGGAWSVKWIGGTAGRPITAATVSDKYGEYRLYWALGGAVYYMPLSIDILNPEQITDYAYALSAEHITPNFDGDDSTAVKLALSLSIETHECTATETITPYYEINNNGTWVAMTVIQTAGTHLREFPDSDTPEGLEFRQIRFKFEFARDAADSSKTPHMHRWEMRFRRKLPPRWAWQFTISTLDPAGGATYGGQTIAQMRADIEALLLQNAKAGFTFRDLDPNRTYWVDIVQCGIVENTGHDERGKFNVVVAEP